MVLDGQGFAAVTRQSPKKTLPDRARLPTNWVDTGVQADKSSLEVRKGVRPLSRSLRQGLWLVADLERVVTR